jgi:protocatechuate 3,4-dioxygenase beta subunit
VPNVLVDIWQANATGHYAGMSYHPLPGSSSLTTLRLGHPVPKPEDLTSEPQVGGKRAGLLPPFPRTINHETFLRGAWPTDENGVAQFTSTSPS